MAVFKKSRVSVDDSDTVSYREEKLSSVFSILMTMMKISGIAFLNTTDDFKLTSPRVMLHACYCIAIQTVAVLNAVRYICAFTSDPGIWRYHIGILAFAWFYFMMVYFNMMCLLSAKHFSAFFKTLDQYQFDYGIHFKVNKYKKLLHIMTIALFTETVIATISMVLAVIFGLIRKESLYAMNLWPLHLSTGYTFVTASVLYGIATVMVLTSCLAIMLFYFFVLGCLKKEFSHITTRLANLHQNEPNLFATDLENIRQQHQAIVNILASVNPILRHVAGGCYAMGIPVICFMLYGLASQSILLEDLYKIVFTILGNLIGMFVITFRGAAVNSEAHKPLHELHNYDLTVLPEKTISQISVFVNRFTGSPLGVSVYGLFVIDYSTVLMVFGTIITYAVIAVQFTSVTKICDSGAFNITNVTTKG